MKRLSELMDFMLAEHTIYEGLVQLAGEKKEAIIKNELEKLRAITRDEQKAVKQLKNIDRQKVVVLGQIAAEYNLPGLPTISEVMAVTTGAGDKQKLQDFQNSFMETINALSRLNSTNQKLIETQLNFNQFSIELLSQEQVVGDFYGNSGLVNDEQGSVRRNLIDREV